jgi:hypothetical protein
VFDEAHLEDEVLGDDREVYRALRIEALDAAHEGQYHGQQRKKDLQHQACKQERKVRTATSVTQRIFVGHKAIVKAL